MFYSNCLDTTAVAAANVIWEGNAMCSDDGLFRVQLVLPLFFNHNW